MWKKKDIYDKAIFGLFVFYILAMTWIILFKSVMPSEFYSIVGSRKINLIPFVDIIVGKPYSMFEIIGNAIIFIPFGIFTSMILKDTSISSRIMLGAALSVTYELIQFVLAIGVTDITDVILNTLGAAIGIAALSVMRALIKSEFDLRKTVVICSTAACIPSAMLVPVLSVMWLR